MKTIKIKFQNHSYPVIVGKGTFSQLFRLIETKKLHPNLFIVIDKNVKKYFGKLIRNYFDDYKGKKYYYSLQAFENSKTFEGLKQIHSALLKQQFGRDTLLIAIGGGITGDLAGFAASTFMRGIQLVHVPTTITACVDSSIGGKTGINFNYYKNIIGSFHYPQFVLCDLNFLKTLPKIEIISGLGEIVKYAFTTNNEFYSVVDKNIDSILTLDESIIEKVIKDSILYKISVVTQDEKELGLRKVLNFGHTFGHAFERELKNKIKHGEAVTAGVVCALYLSYKKKLISSQTLERLKVLPLKLKLNRSLRTVDLENIYKNMFSDKKNRNNQINFVLLRNIGEVVLDVHASKSEILFALKNGLHSLNYK